MRAASSRIALAVVAVTLSACGGSSERGTPAGGGDAAAGGAPGSGGTGASPSGGTGGISSGGSAGSGVGGSGGASGTAGSAASAGTAGTGGGLAGGAGSAGSSGAGATAGSAGSSGSAGSGAVGGSAGAATAGSAGSAGAGGGSEPGECSGDDDCPEGTCERIPDEPGGYWACVTPQPPATQPSENPGMDECSTSNDCDPECECYRVEEVYPGFYHPHNECACSECRSDGDCDQGEICIPGGAWNLPADTCRSVYCATDADCTREPGGACVAYFDSCSVNPDWFSGKACHYPSSPCCEHADCERPESCAPDWQEPERGLICQALPCPG